MSVLLTFVFMWQACAYQPPVDMDRAPVHHTNHLSAKGLPGFVRNLDLGGRPSDQDSICTIEPYLDPGNSYSDNALALGEQVPDFKLYTTEGEEVHLQQEFADEKPILLINGSYTCPLFRDKVAAINNFAITYGAYIKVLVIYTVEHDPDGQSSPYRAEFGTLDINKKEHILLPQARTYGERRSAANDMLKDFNLVCPLLLDSPCNDWWKAFGQAPNRAYLLDTDGTVYASHGWFHPETMVESVEALLTRE